MCRGDPCEEEARPAPRPRRAPRAGADRRRPGGGTEETPHLPQEEGRRAQRDGRLDRAVRRRRQIRVRVGRRGGLHDEDGGAVRPGAGRRRRRALGGAGVGRVAAGRRGPGHRRARRRPRRRRRGSARPLRPAPHATRGRDRRAPLARGGVEALGAVAQHHGDAAGAGPPRLRRACRPRGARARPTPSSACA